TGGSAGAEIDFNIDGGNDAVRVFTTRPDTVFGATYVVLAPEHPLVDRLTSAQQREVVTRYRDAVAKRDLIERKKIEKEKSGVFTGSHCINPATGKRVP